MDTDGGGWTVFQRRQDGSVDFYLEWDDYKRGFGNIGKEFWLGFDHILPLLGASESGNELRIDLGDGQGNRKYAKYSVFGIGDESTMYRLSVNGYSGNANDSLAYHNGRRFSAEGRDNDNWPYTCTLHRYGAWWYKNCHRANLNGGYFHTTSKGILWRDWKEESLKFTEMKFRPK